MRLPVGQTNASKEENISSRFSNSMEHSAPQKFLSLELRTGKIQLLSFRVHYESRCRRQKSFFGKFNARQSFFSHFRKREIYFSHYFDI